MGLSVCGGDSPAVHLEVTSKDNLHKVCCDVSVGLGAINERVVVLSGCNKLPTSPFLPPLI